MDVASLQAIVSFAMACVLWLVQLIIYPSFLYFGKSELLEWHPKYTFRVSFIIMPLMLIQLGLALWQALRTPSVLMISVLILVSACWILTFFVSVPLHKKLAAGEVDHAVLVRLVRTNWPRTILWSLIAALQFQNVA